MTHQDYLTNMSDDMELRGLSERTMTVYTGAVSLYLKYCKERGCSMGETSFRQFLLDTLHSGKTSKTTCNLYNSAIRFFLEVTLGQDINYARTARFRREYHYPEVLTVEEVKQFISVIDDIKYRAVFLNIYGSGLRASEIGNLRVSDVESSNMRLLIRQGKRKKDRYTILSNAGLLALREYWKAYRPKDVCYFQKWVVYCKPPFKNAGYVVEYLGRYTHRVAISNNRILSMDDGKVTFKWRDYSDGNKQKVMTLSANEFIRRFFMHILPKGFSKIRHFGFLSSRGKHLNLKRCKFQTHTSLKFKRLSTDDLLEKILGRKPSVCPDCGCPLIHNCLHPPLLHI